MATGGATWDDAGALEPGSGNAFTVADATVDDVLYNQAWWKFTADVPLRSTITSSGTNVVVYYGDEADAVQVSYADYGGSFAVFYALSGVEYHVLVGTVSPTSPPTTYTVSLGYGALAATDWISTLQDDPDNALIISGTSLHPGDLLLENPGTFADHQDWYDDVIQREGGLSGRTGFYFVQQTLGGTDAFSAGDCAWDHARHGDEDNQLWNSSTTDPDDTSGPLCRSLGGGPAGVELNSSTSTYELTYAAPGIFTGSSMSAEIRMRSRALWFLAAREHLDERGVLDGPDPEADGVPADQAALAQVEWENDLELVKVEVAGDTEGRPASGTIDAGDGVTFALNDAVLPVLTGGTWAPQWNKGALGSSDGTGRPYLQVAYQDGDPDWTELEEITSWDDCQPLDGDLPDETLAIAMTQVLVGPSIGASGSNAADIAVRLTFRSPRYRWVYDGLIAPAPRRVYPSDIVGGGRARVYPRGRALIGGRRTAGSYL